MNCERTRALLGAHLDGELDAVNDHELQSHLRECPRCLSVAGQQQARRRILRQELPYHRAPEGLESRIQSALRGHARTAPQPHSAERERVRPRFAWLWQYAAAAATLAAIVAALWTGSAITARRARSEFLAEELVSAHVRSLEGTHLTDVQSSDQHTVKPWFDGKVDFAPQVRDLAAAGFPLIGGRMEYLWGQSAAALVFQRNKHFINMFIWRSAADASPESILPARRGYNIVAWQQDDLVYCAISDLNRPELEGFTREYRKQ